MHRLVLEQATSTDLHAIADFVEQSCATWVKEARTLYHIQLAIDEACSNIFEHAYGGQAGRLEIEIRGTRQQLTLQLRDWGRPFDPDSVPPPDPDLSLEERPIGGLGVHLIRQIMDQVTYRFDSEMGNTLILKKRLR